MPLTALHFMTFAGLALLGLCLVGCFFVAHSKNKPFLKHDQAINTDRSCGYWTYIFASTALCFSAWCLLGQPALIYYGGEAFGALSYASITIPFAGLLFLKRQKILFTHFEVYSPLELYGCYFQSNALRLTILSLTVVLCVSLFALLLFCAGTVIHHVSNGAVSSTVGMAGFCFFVLLHSLLAHIRTFLIVSCGQFFLFVLAILGLSLVMIVLSGGIEAFVERVNNLGSLPLPPSNKPHNLSQLVDPIELVSSFGDVFVFSVLIGLMGLQTSPLFSQLALSTKNLSAFAAQQVWWSGCFYGGALLTVSIFIGLGAHLAPLDMASLLNGSQAGLTPAPSHSVYSVTHLSFVPLLIQQVIHISPFLFGLLTVSVLATLYLSAGLILKLTLHLIKGEILKGSAFSRPMSHKFSVVSASLLALLFYSGFGAMALYMAIYLHNFLPVAVSLGIAFSFQMVSALIGLCYVPWFTGRAVLAGLIAGLLVVCLTDGTCGLITDLLGIQLPFEAHPYAIYSAIWGLVANMVLVVFISFFTQSRNSLDHRHSYHHVLDLNISKPASHGFLLPFAWAVSFVWFFFAIGPGASLKTVVWGHQTSPESWLFPLPFFWVWTVFWWAFGVFMLWLWAYPLQLSRPETCSSRKGGL